MKSAIVYYSYSGNTGKVAGVLAEHLRQKGEVNVLEIRCLEESHQFLTQCRRAFNHVRGEIQPINFDLTIYDSIYIGSPVWAFAPAPAINTYLDKCSGLEGKTAVVFTTFGSGTGNQRCLNYMKEALTKKGAKKVSQFTIQQGKINNNEFIISEIKRGVE